VTSSLANVRALQTSNIEVLHTAADIKRVSGTENPCGSTGYVNWSSGWADAEGAMRWLRQRVEETGRVELITGRVSRLLFTQEESEVRGAQLEDGKEMTADLTILAAGAWTPSLLDLRGICKSTGQVLTYIPISAAEEDILSRKPTLLNLSTGLFIIPPSQGLLKVARHGHGYVNPTTIPHPELPNQEITVSLPPSAPNNLHQAVPLEGMQSCREFLSHTHPRICIPSRPFTHSRICWYTDTRTGDFLIDYHPKWKGLFVATGGSGHAFKFLPVIGDLVVRCVVGDTPEDFQGKWDWPAERVPEEEWPGDGSRGGPVGMVLSEEMARSMSKL
jgi:sarcosine oxidase / L-pipecolate oxidase